MDVQPKSLRNNISQKIFWYIRHEFDANIKKLK